MKIRLLGALFSLSLLAACASDMAPQAADTDFGSEGTSYKNAAGEDITYGTMQDFAEKTDDIVYFAFDSSSLSETAMLALKGQATWLNTYPATMVTIEGHCDDRGTREYNLALGERRANAVKNYLVSLGVSPSRIAVISYGKERPVAVGANEDAWSLNRRAVSIIQ